MWAIFLIIYKLIVIQAQILLRNWTQPPQSSFHIKALSLSLIFHIKISSTPQLLGYKKNMHIKQYAIYAEWFIFITVGKVSSLLLISERLVSIVMSWDFDKFVMILAWGRAMIDAKMP